MKKTIFLFALSIAVISCKDDEEDLSGINFKEEMRNFVIGISQYAKSNKSNFIIIPQNGIELVTSSGEENDSLHTAYKSAIDGNGQEDLFYGYDNDDQETSAIDKNYLLTFLDKSKSAGNAILVTDYCSTQSKMDNSYIQNNSAGFVSFAATQRELDIIPNYPNPIFGENNNIISSLSEVKNFLYMINNANYNSKADFIAAITATNYDLLIMDCFFDETTEFTPGDINQLKNKANGGKRLIVSYISIGEAEDYRYYWQSGWNSDSPSWIDGENPDWEGNYKVKYWEAEWQSIIFGNTNSYLKKILDANFDGAYLDIIDAFEYYE